MSNYEQKTQALAVVSSNSFERSLTLSVSQREAQGRSGIGDFKVVNGNGIIDNANTVKRNFWMDESLRKLGCKIAETDKKLCPHQWAAWMMNANFREEEKRVVFNLPTPFRVMMAKERLKENISNYFKKPVFFQASQSLREAMES